MNAWQRLQAGLGGAAIALALAGCVTINIYFPAAAAEKAADRIIDQVYRIDSGKNAPGEKPPAQ
jgi:hypothetical protein